MVVQTDSSENKLPNYNGIFTGDLSGWVTKRGKFIDSAALAFMAKETGCLVTDFNGGSLPPLHSCQNYSYQGAIVATSSEVHQDLLAAFTNKQGRMAIHPYYFIVIYYC